MNPRLSAIAAFIVFGVTLFATIALGQDAPEDGSQVGDTASLTHGDRAPWDGMLVREEDLFGLQRQAFELQFRLDAETHLRASMVEAHAHEMAAVSTACQERIDLRTSLWEQRATELNASLASARAREGPQWWDYLGAGAVGVVIGLIAGVIIGVAVLH